MVSIESGLGGKVVAARVEWVLVVEVWAWASWFDQQFMCGLKRESSVMVSSYLVEILLCWSCYSIPSVTLFFVCISPHYLLLFEMCC